MSATVLENALVRDYLRILRAATVTLPAGQARELREQIAAHLAEVLPPEAGDAEVAAELRRLGPARVLAAEAAGPVPPPATVRLRNRLSHLSWRGWTLIAVAVVLIVAPAAAVVTYLNAVNNAMYSFPLETAGAHGGLERFWFPRDQQAPTVRSSAGDVTQITVPERWGQRQGITVGIYNDSDWPKTILGPGGSWAVTPGAFAPVLIAVGSGPGLTEAGAYSTRTRWNLPDTIPPHSYRTLRVIWTSRLCLQVGETQPIQTVTLRVRVGLLTRDQDIRLNTAWAIGGTPASSSAAACHA